MPAHTSKALNTSINTLSTRCDPVENFGWTFSHLKQIDISVDTVSQFLESQN